MARKHEANSKEQIVLQSKRDWQRGIGQGRRSGHDRPRRPECERTLTEPECNSCLPDEFGLDLGIFVHSRRGRDSRFLEYAAFVGQPPAGRASATRLGEAAKLIYFSIPMSRYAWSAPWGKAR